MRVRRLAVTFMLALAVVLSGALLSGQGKAADQAAPPSGLSIVQLAEYPVVGYTGDIRGFAATKPRPGQKIDPLDPKVIAYVGYLKSRHDTVLRHAGNARKVYDYVYTFNGFAAELTDEQVALLRTRPDVVAITRDEFREMDTSSTPTFLGLDAPGGLWEQLGGIGKAGDGIIIGIIDSGIWPESLSFSDRTGTNGNATKDGKLSYQQIPGWHGKCVPGEAFNASLCNQKLIGAQFFNAAWGGDAGIDAQRPWEFNSVRDYNGHGTHTSSTAGGNRVAPTGPVAAFGAVTGMAPHARLAMYKALWSTQDASTASGATSDLVAAIDQAVVDGVDVINYSISGTQTNFLDPVEVSFLYAAQAGVFVAASAGNSGPTVSTVAHPSPWITTVAAGTHNRSMEGSVTLGNGTPYYGASAATATVTAPLIDSIAAGLPGANPTYVALCYAAVDNGGVPVLDPALVAGKIVVCDRGVTARVNKSRAVFEAGGVGMILVNTSNASLNADFHSVPSVHLQYTARDAVKAYATMAGSTATISLATANLTAPAPFTASFSSRGPLRAGNGDLLKPDVIAPGQDILAAVSPVSSGGLDFNLYSGTSMSSPHVAGLAALFKDLYPNWTPMMIKSALMTSAYDILDGPNTHPLVIFRQGAGHVRPNEAMNPGLVYNSTWNDWLAFLCGATTGVAQPTCDALTSMGYSLDPSDLNVPSIAIGDMAGIQTVRRRVTNVGTARATYSASYTGLAGLTVEVTPSTLTLNPGQTGAFTVRFTRTTAALNAYVAGQFTWSDGAHQVRIPVVIQPVALAAPAQVYTQANTTYNVTFGYTGAFTATPRGLVPAVTNDGSVNTGQSIEYPLAIPASTTYARISLFNERVAPPSDLDLRVYRVTADGLVLVGSSGGGTSNEEVNLVNPTPGAYTVYVDGYATANPTTFTLFTWVLGAADAGNMAVTAPAAATTGVVAPIGLSFTGLIPGTMYLGSVAYGGVAGMPNPTIIRVDW